MDGELLGELLFRLVLRPVLTLKSERTYPNKLGPFVQTSTQARSNVNTSATSNKFEKSEEVEVPRKHDQSSEYIAI